MMAFMLKFKAADQTGNTNIAYLVDSPLQRQDALLKVALMIHDVDESKAGVR